MTSSGKGHSNPSVQRLLLEIKADIETGSSLTQAFASHPLYFDALFCNLVGAGERPVFSTAVLDRLAIYKEKILAIKSKIKSALFYPISIIVVAFVITAVIMIFVIPAFKELFSSFGADLPGPTLVVMAMSDFFVAVVVGDIRWHWWRHLFFCCSVEAIAQGADVHGPGHAQAADFWCGDRKSHHRALDPHPVDHVRRGRAAG